MVAKTHGECSSWPTRAKKQVYVSAREVMTIYDLARIAYDAFREAANLHHCDQAYPAWENLPTWEKEAWQVAASAARCFGSVPVDDPEFA